MSYDKVLNELGAESMSFERNQSRNGLQDGSEISEDLKELLKKFQTAIVFSNGAKFKTPTKIPAADNNGFVYLDIIYGLTPDANNIYYKNEIHSKQIDGELYTFGESGGGDQFCISKKTGKVYYWLHEAKDDASSLFLISPSFTEFLEHLAPDNDEDNSKDDDDGIVSVEFNF
ncbi:MULTISPECIES: SMI1/KNR4 family protein [Pseudomonas]|uniref:SMI1/KNR4 family protein n=1 Tax=Pseudomonas TaxID=286 RepID=UPI0009BB6F3A|nr:MULTISPECIES: SMI1/KNR4 family protein [Pseudomonas]UUT19628.1 SMI1/KNR4 family protein [Pseudomonas sp. T8]